MYVHINTDQQSKSHAATADYFKSVVETALNHISAHITRVEVHLSDEDGHKNGKNLKHCVMEARVEGCRPVAATHRAESPEKAVSGAADKLARRLNSTLERIHDQKTRRPEPTLTEQESTK